MPLLVHPEWADRFPWLFQGTTRRGDGVPFDLRLDGTRRRKLARDRWDRLAWTAGFDRVVRSAQVHGADVAVHVEVPAGRTLSGRHDGHVTATPGILLAVTVADCVPVSILDPRGPAVALVHAGWRGTAARVLERAVRTLASACAADPARLHVHLGPAICGECYEVGPEVHEALGTGTLAEPAPVDLREVLGRHASAAGVPRGSITVSTHCTRCGDAGLFSHRGGDAGRQVGLLGIRDGPP